MQKKYLPLTIGFLAIAATLALRPAHTQDCPTMSSYMINAAGQCVGLDASSPTNATDPDIKTQRAAALTPSVKFASPFPPQQNVNTIVVDNNEAFLAAIRRLKAGDRLLVKDGTYRARVVSSRVTVTAQGNAENWVVIAAFPGHKPQIKGTNDAAIGISGARYVEIRGFDVVGAYPSQNPSGNGISIGDRSQHIRVIDNTLHDVPGGAIEAQHSDYLYIEGNTIYNSAWGWLPTNTERSYANSAISFYQLTDGNESTDGIRNIVRNNMIFNTYNTKPFLYGEGITDGNCFILDDTKHTQPWGAAVQAGFTEPYSGTTLVENNLCVDNGGRGIHVFFSENLIARNNTLYANSKTPGISGDLSAGQSSNIRFYNNIIYANAGAKVIANDKTTDVEIEDNLIFGSSQMDSGVGRVIQADPLFVNPSVDWRTADFSLRPGSPAIGAGSADNCATTYFDGSPRNGTCNIGAFPVAQ